MKTNRLGESDVYVSEIGFGCMSLGHDHTENARLLHRAVHHGVTFFDTADLYDRGSNEQSVGRAFRGMRERVVIASKVGNRWRKDGSGWDWDASPAYIRGALEASLKRLETDYLDLYQLHGGTLDDDIDEVVATFKDLRAQGLIRAYGISSIRPNVIRAWLERSDMASVMTQYSLLDRRPEEATLDLLLERGVGVIARGPVAKGILSGAGGARVSEGFLDHTPEELERVRVALRAFVTPECSAAQLALRYSLAHPAVATAVPGASRAEQLMENVGAAEVILSAQEHRELQGLARANRYTQHR